MNDKTTLGPIERVLVQLDVLPLGALIRAVIGWAFVSTFRMLARTGVSDWRIIPCFFAMLIGVRVVPAIFRAVTPIAPTTRTVWMERRVLAKRFDSYQWRKLVWFGVGMTAYVLMRGDFDVWLIALDTTITTAGCLGELVWQLTRVREGLSDPESELPG